MASSLRLYTEPCRSNARVPSGGICSSVLDISFHRIKALAAISSPLISRAAVHRPKGYDRRRGGGRERRRDRQRRERERERERLVKEGEDGLRDREMRARLRACRAGEDGSG